MAYFENYSSYTYNDTERQRTFIIKTAQFYLCTEYTTMKILQKKKNEIETINIHLFERKKPTLVRPSFALSSSVASSLTLCFNFRASV